MHNVPPSQDHHHAPVCLSKTTVLPGTAYSPPPPPVPAAPLFDPRAVDAFDLEKETKRRKKGEKQAWSSAFTRHHRKHAWHSEAEQTKEKLNVIGVCNFELGCLHLF